MTDDSLQVSAPEIPGLDIMDLLHLVPESALEAVPAPTEPLRESHCIANGGRTIWRQPHALVDGARKCGRPAQLAHARAELADRSVLHLVEPAIGFVIEQLGVASVIGKAGHSRAHRDALTDLLPHAGCQLLGLSPSGTGTDHRELVPAHAADDVALPNCGLESVDDRAEEIVPGGVTLLVVDSLEAVQVERLPAGLKSVSRCTVSELRRGSCWHWAGRDG